DVHAAHLQRAHPHGLALAARPRAGPLRGSSGWLDRRTHGNVRHHAAFRLADVERRTRGTGPAHAFLRGQRQRRRRSTTRPGRRVALRVGTRWRNLMNITVARRLSIVLAISLMSAGCELIGDIFQAGIVIGVVVVLLIVAVIAWIARKFRRT